MDGFLTCEGIYHKKERGQERSATSAAISWTWVVWSHPDSIKRRVNAYFVIASMTLSMICSLRFFIPNHTTIAIEAPSPIPSPHASGVMIV